MDGPDTSFFWGEGVRLQELPDLLIYDFPPSVADQLDWGDCGSPILHLNIFSEHPFLQVTHTSEDGSPSSGEAANLASTIG